MTTVAQHRCRSSLVRHSSEAPDRATSTDRGRESSDPAAVARARVAVAAQRLFDAEGALHIAHQTRVDSWITAANNRLHEAIMEYEAARQAAGMVGSAAPGAASQTA
jgi:hypothetical protein